MSTWPDLKWWQYILLIIYLSVLLIFMTIQIYQTLETLNILPNHGLVT